MSYRSCHIGTETGNRVRGDKVFISGSPLPTAVARGTSPGSAGRTNPALVTPGQLGTAHDGTRHRTWMTTVFRVPLPWGAVSFLESFPAVSDSTHSQCQLTFASPVDIGLNLWSPITQSPLVWSCLAPSTFCKLHRDLRAMSLAAL